MIKSITGAAMVIAAAFILSACGGKANGSKAAAKNGEGTKSAQGISVAYVEVDSIMTQYTFAKDYAALLKKKMQRIQSTLQSRGMALQREAAEFQQKMQAGQMTQEQAQQKQASLQKQQQQLQNLQESLTNEYQKQQDAYNDALHDSIQNFLKSYNKDLGYTYILSKSGDNILFADKSLDITDDVIKGLNKRYKPAKEAGK